MSSTQNTPGFPIYVTGDPASPRAIIVLQEAFGVNFHIRDVADRFAATEHFVVAPHLFHRQGAPEIPYDEFEQAMATMATVTREGLDNDLNATTEFLGSLGFGPSSIGAVGFCMGGSVAFYLATLGTVGAVASFYGGGISNARLGLPPLLELARQLRTPWLGLYGDLDAGIPVDDVEALRAATARAVVSTEIIRYANAGHGFHCDPRPAAYNDEAARDAYQCTLDFFDVQLSDK